MEANVMSDVRTEITTTSEGMSNVMMWNDDTTSMDAVVLILLEVFKKGIDAAMELMLEAHLHGKVCVETAPKKLAKARQRDAMNLAKQMGYPDFTITVEEG